MPSVHSWPEYSGGDEAVAPATRTRDPEPPSHGHPEPDPELHLISRLILPLSPLVLFLGLFFLFLRTLHPAFQLDDSPETIAAGVNLSVQHAPGYPAVTLLGRLASALPLGGVTFRINLLAALLATGCALACLSIVRSLIPGRTGILAGVLAALWFATARITWECALSAKGAIYLFNLLMLALATRALIAGGARHLLLAAALVGAALGGHWMTAIWWLPVLAIAGRPWTTRRAGLAAVMIAAGASLTIVLPLCAAREPAWGDAGSLTGLGEILLRRTFLPQAALKPGWLTAAQVADGLFAPLREGGVGWLLAGIAGLVALWRRRPAACGAVVTGPLLTVAAVAVLANPVHLPSGELLLWLSDRFHLPWLLAIGVGAGTGLDWLAGVLPRYRSAITLAFAALVAAGASRHGARLDHSTDYLGWDFAENLRSHALAARGSGGRPVSILAEADYQSFPLLVPLHLTGGLPNVRCIVTNPFLDRPGGWHRLARRNPEAAGLAAAGGRLTGAPGEAAETRITALVDRLRESGPVLHLPMCSYPGLRRRLAPAGLLFEVRDPPPPPVPGTAPTGLAATVRVPPIERLRWRGVTAGNPARDAAAWSVLDVYGLTRIAPAGSAFRAGRFDEVVTACERALPFTGGFGRAHLLTTIGHARARQLRYEPAEAAFRAAMRIRPRDPDLWTNVATACAAQGKTGEALKWFERVLRRYPGHPGARANLAMLRNQLAGGVVAPRPPRL